METHDKTLYQIYNLLILILGGLFTLALSGFYWGTEEELMEQLSYGIASYAINRMMVGWITALFVVGGLYLLNATLNRSLHWDIPKETLLRRATLQYATLFVLVIITVFVFVVLPRSMGA